MDWEEATGVLRGWAGRSVVAVPYLEPGISVDILRGELAVADTAHATVRVHVDGTSIAMPRATFIAAEWVPGHDGDGLSIVQGAARVDVFLADAVGDGDGLPG